MALGMCRRSCLFRRFVEARPSLVQRRRQHSSGRGHMVEVDLSVAGANTVDEMVHKLMVLKSTPDWLPFLPGSSFWVPPPRSNSNLTASMSIHLSQGHALRYPSNVGVEEVEERGGDIEKMLDEVQILEARAVAEAEAEAKAETQADADAEVEAQAETVAEAATESKSRAATNSRKTPLYENDEG